MSNLNSSCKFSGRFRAPPNEPRKLFVTIAIGALAPLSGAAVRDVEQTRPLRHYG
jgi:hypothetical protein